MIKLLVNKIFNMTLIKILTINFERNMFKW